MNVVIMIAVIMIAGLSVGNSSVYGSSRTLAALADRGQAPKIFGYIDRAGRRLVSIIFASAIGFLCYLFALGPDTRTEAFNWVLAISGLASIFIWGSICLCHIRFRRAWKLQGHSAQGLAFRSQAGVIGSWVGFIFNCLILVAQFWTGFAPVGCSEMTSGERVKSFFQGYLAAPIVIVMYLGLKIWKRTSIIRAKDMDLVSGIREVNIAELLAEERAERPNWPAWKRVYKTVC